MYHASATAFGVKEAHHGLNSFMSEMDAIINHASDQGEPTGPTAEEIAFFERMERAALANQQNK